jgi:hypothetical protein
MPIIHIAFCDFFVVDEELMTYRVLENKKDFGGYHLITLNLPFYSQTTNNDFEQWLLLITNAHTFEDLPEAITTLEIKAAFESIKISNLEASDLK